MMRKYLANNKMAKVVVMVMVALVVFLSVAAYRIEAADTKLNVGDYKGERTESEWLVPTQEGKVFAGWYTDETYAIPYTETTGEAYAKFVDAKVLSVYKQLRSNTTYTSETTDIRFLTSVDTLKFDSVGFKVNVNCSPNKRDFNLVEHTAYTSILVDGKTEPEKPEDVFGTEEANYFVVHSLIGIPKAVYEDTISVTPYWYTPDGTKVEGTPKNFTLREEYEIKATLSKTVLVEKYKDTFTLDYSKLGETITGATLDSVTVGDTAFATKIYSDGKLTLDTATLTDLGDYTVTANLTAANGNPIIVTANIKAYTMVINDEAELNQLPTVIATNAGTGHYILGNDIVCSGTYPSATSEVEFTGVFDGCGYTIYNMTTSNDGTNRQGLFGWKARCKGSSQNGIFKNTSFVNAKHEGKGGFIATYLSLNMENVYIQIDISQNGTGWGTASSVLGTDTYWDLKVKNVLVEYINPLPTEATTGYAVYGMNLNQGSYKGLYVIGAERVMSVVAAEGAGDTYGAYMTRDAFRAANLDLSAWEGDFWTVVDGIPTPKKLAERTVDDVIKVGKYDADTFTVDLDSVKEQIVGATFAKAIVDGTAFANASYADSVLTLDTATLSSLGDQTVRAIFTTEDAETIVLNINITVYTMVINNETELNMLPKVIEANEGAGHYILGNDIECSGTYPSAPRDTSSSDASAGVYFTGIFDGCGYTIYNMTTSNDGTMRQGLLGYFTKGTLKNVSFVNATHKGSGGFIASTMKGTMENVYIQIDVAQNSEAGTNSTSVLGTWDGFGTSVKKVIVEYIPTLATEATSGGVMRDATIGNGYYQGLYVIGAQKIYSRSELVGTDGKTDVYGAYLTRDDFRAANVDVSSWEGDFWTVINGIPTPKNLAAYTLDGVLTVGKDESATFTVDLSSVKDEITGSTLAEVTVDGTAFAKASYKDGILTLDTKTLNLGDQTIKVVFTKNDMVSFVVNVNVSVYTLVINDEAELNKLPKVIAANEGAGHYILGNDIVCSGIYPSATSDVIFTGTFDGCGYAIYNMTTSKDDNTRQGLLGSEARGTIKNISFINAKHEGLGGFIAATLGATMENVYIQIDIAQNGVNGKVTTSVLGTWSQWRLKAKKVLVEYITPLSETATTGFVVRDMFEGYGSYQGVYAIGANKISKTVSAATEGQSEIEVYGAYMTRDAFRAANVDVSAWEGDFWTIVDGIPTPKNTQTYRATNVLHEVDVTESDRKFIVDGESEYKLIIGDGDKTKKAASYLVKYLEKATGYTLEYATAEDYTAGGNYIVFNVPELFEEAELTMPEEDLSQTGYYIKSVADNVFIASQTETGAQFAMLAFLRQTVGFTMYSSDTYVFEKDGSTLPDMEIVEKPDMEYFSMNNGVGSSEAKYMMGGNSMSFIEVDGQPWHNTLNYLPKDTYASAHSDWYSTNGKELCFTAHGNDTELSSMVSEMATKVLQLAEANPDNNFISISIEDNTTVCECNACTASAEKYNGSNAAAMIQFVNQVNQVVQAKLQEQADADGTTKRELEIYTMAYRGYENPPVKENADGTYSAIDETVILDKNVHVLYAPIDAKYTHSFLEGVNDSYNEMSRKWNAISTGAYTWIYETNFSNYLYPYNSWATQLETFRVLVDNESMAFMSQGQWNMTGHTGFTDFKNYINSCGIFDLSTSFVEIKEDYFANVYLEAGPAMEQYFDELYAYMADLEETYSEYTGDIYDDIAEAEYWSYEQLTRWMSLIDEAYEAIDVHKEDTALYDKLYKRITLESLFLRYALIEHHSDAFTSQELAEMQLAFYEDCTQYNVTKDTEWTDITDVFTRWGFLTVDGGNAGKYDSETFTVDLSSVQTLSGATLTKAKLDDTAFTTATYVDGVLTLDTNTLDSLGDKTIKTIFITEDDKAVIVMIDITVYTMVINDETELNMLPKVIEANEGAGHYILGNDIECSGTYPSAPRDTSSSDTSAGVYFTGIFDGCGYTIYNMTTSNDGTMRQGLLGYFTKGTLKNVSFVNAIHKGTGGFIASTMKGTMENVYIQIDVAQNSEAGSNSTAVFGTWDGFGTSVKKVLVEYIPTLATNATSGGIMRDATIGNGYYQGLYVIGAQKIYSRNELVGTDGKTDVYGAYLTRDAFCAANIDVSAWEGDFWTIVDGIPTPKNLVTTE